MLEVAPEIPGGIYSISYKTRWRAPDSGKNSMEHLIIWLSVWTLVSKLEDDLRDYETKKEQSLSNCQNVRITTMSKLA